MKLLGLARDAWTGTGSICNYHESDISINIERVIILM